MQPREGQFD
nr:unnamed protein product [Callosobruchus chinensis]